MKLCVPYYCNNHVLAMIRVMILMGMRMRIELLSRNGSIVAIWTFQERIYPTVPSCILGVSTNRIFFWKMIPVFNKFWSLIVIVAWQSWWIAFGVFFCFRNHLTVSSDDWLLLSILYQRKSDCFLFWKDNRDNTLFQHACE